VGQQRHAVAELRRLRPRVRQGRGPYGEAFEVQDLDLAGEGAAAAAAGGGSIAGAVALITGSTVGAGVLALPATVAPAGFVPSSATMLLCWAVLLVDALLLAEVNIAMMRERDEVRLEHGRGHSPISISLRAMAGRTLGPKAAVLTSLGYLFCSVALMVAYVAKAGSILEGTGAVDYATGATLFTAALGATIYGGGTRAADLLNRPLTAGMLVLFALILAGGAPLGNGDALGAMHWERAVGTCPILFLALVFHDLVPVVCSYLDGDMGKVRRALVAGSAIPVAMFLAWDAVTLALSGGGAPGADPLDSVAEVAGLAPLVQGFSIVAIVTSMIGTTLSFSEYTVAELQEASDRLPSSLAAPPALRGWWRRGGLRAASFLLVLAPPVAISLANPGIFLDAANFAGAYGMAILYGVMPPLMVMALRRSPGASARVEPTTRGGDLGLGATASFAGLVTGNQLLSDLALFAPSPDVGGAAAVEQVLEQGPAVAEQALAAAAALDALAAGPLFEAVAGAP